MPPRPLLLLAVLPLAACAGQPRHRSPLAAAGRVLAIDFDQRRVAHVGALPERLHTGASSELARVGDLPPPAPLVANETTRLVDASRTAKHLAANEASRRPNLPDVVLPDAGTFGQALADALADLPALLWPRRPMGEIDDRRHRTDPADDRPEASLWQRLRRRLLP
jgi:hypothetical protein